MSCNCFPPEVLESIFSLLAPSKRDLDNISLVCKSWYIIERSCRKNLVISNCFALSPERLVGWFTKLKSLTLKGRPKEDDPQLRKSAALAYSWIEALTRTCPGLEEIKLKRMVVSDNSLVLIAHHFRKLKSLVLVQCNGFSTRGLAAIASNCSFLEVLDLQEDEIMDGAHNWLSCFPERFTSLECLNFACLKGAIDLEALERLVVRCPNLRSLRLSKAVPFDVLRKILVQAPQLLDLGVGSYVQTPNSESEQEMNDAVLNCPSIRRLSGFLEVTSSFLPALFPILPNLTFLELSSAMIRNWHLVNMLRECRNLQQLWVSDSIDDIELEIVTANCKYLEELKVFPLHPPHIGGTTVGSKALEAISVGCPRLKYLLYHCRRVTNAALISVAKNCPDITHFELHACEPKAPDHKTSKPFDEGIQAIVSSCKKLKHLCLSVCLSDQVFLDIGMNAKQLEMLSISFCGESDNGILFALSGCEKLKRLMVRNSPFSDATLKAAAWKYEALEYFVVSSCEITLGACKALARAYPKLNVEIRCGVDEKIERMHIYRNLDGVPADRPWYICTL